MSDLEKSLSPSSDQPATLQQQRDIPFVLQVDRLAHLKGILMRMDSSVQGHQESTDKSDA